MSNSLFGGKLNMASVNNGLDIVDLFDFYEEKSSYEYLFAEQFHKRALIPFGVFKNS